MQGILTTTELACAHIAATASLKSTYDGHVNVYTGVDNEDKQAAAVICYAESATEDYPLSGIWHVRTQILTKEIAARSSIQKFDTLLGDIQSAFLTGSIENDLMQKVSNYAVYQVLFDGNSSTTDGDAWVHTLSLDIVCTITN